MHKRVSIKNRKQCDVIILGAGIYGLYAALVLAKKHKHIIVVDIDSNIFGRASMVNQARLHNGYHYPRSIETAEKTAYYYNRFARDFESSINASFKQIYAISSNRSKTSPDEYIQFCLKVGIPIRACDTDRYFVPGSTLAAFETKECSFDFFKVKNELRKRISRKSNISIELNKELTNIVKDDTDYVIEFDNTHSIRTSYVVNATYASVNQINARFGLEKYKIKYELCEVCLCKASSKMKGAGLTVADGLYFSIMPFGLQPLHTLTSVMHTPQQASYDEQPSFPCQPKSHGTCSSRQLGNCNTCIAKPPTAWENMVSLSKKYLVSNINLDYQGSMFAIKPILLASEIDDSRPTVIRQLSTKPRFISVLSGKINTIYDLDDRL